MQTEGWCFKHNRALHMVPMSGNWVFICPECLEERKLYTTTSMNTAVQTRSTPILDYKIHPNPPTTADDPWWRCGNCGKQLATEQYAYCPWCGKEVAWND